MHFTILYLPITKYTVFHTASQNSRSKESKEICKTSVSSSWLNKLDVFSAAKNDKFAIMNFARI
jgi:hypothetical protein